MFITFAVTFALIPALARANDAGPFDPGSSDLGSVNGDSTTAKENERLMASALALFLGPFGAHRLYFGTTAKVPVIYGITFGGFGVLVVLDLGHILFTRDLERFRDCDRVFMWSQGRRPTTPP
jgi:TM2 domain-containing membrane protein YozV